MSEGKAPRLVHFSILQVSGIYVSCSEFQYMCIEFNFLKKLLLLVLKYYHDHLESCIECF